MNIFIRFTRFTLVELLMVIAIIVLLAALFLPALRSAKVRAKTISCQNNLKQSGLLHFSYMNDYNEYLPANKNPGSNPGFNLWLVYLNDYTTSKNIYRCPTGYPDSYSSTYCYGAEDGRSFLKLQAVCNHNPLYYPLLADSSHTTYTASGTHSYYQLYAIGFGTQNACIFLRHSNYANVFFGDGRVEEVNKVKMGNAPYIWDGWKRWLVAGYGDF